MKLYDNPYKNEYWEAKKEQDRIDNEVAYAMAKIVAFLMAIGVIYLLFKE
jgi:hypothetical protein